MTLIKWPSNGIRKRSEEPLSPFIEIIHRTPYSDTSVADDILEKMDGSRCRHGKFSGICRVHKSDFCSFRNSVDTSRFLSYRKYGKKGSI